MFDQEEDRKRVGGGKRREEKGSDQRERRASEENCSEDKHKRVKTRKGTRELKRLERHTEGQGQSKN